MKQDSVCHAQKAHEWLKQKTEEEYVQVRVYMYQYTLLDTIQSVCLDWVYVKLIFVT